MSDLSLPESLDSLRQWLVSFRDACETLNRATHRRAEIRALGEIVRKKSSEEMEEHRRVNEGKNDADRPPYPQVSDIPEQREIEKINHDISTALNEVVIQRSSLILMLAPMASDREMKEAGKICKRPTAFSNDALIALVDEMIRSSPEQPEKLRKESPATKFRNDLIRRELKGGKSRPQLCEILDSHNIPTTPQMRSEGVDRWTIAWEDSEFKKNVRQVFAKAVKPLAVSIKFPRQSPKVV